MAEEEYRPFKDLKWIESGNVQTPKCVLEFEPKTGVKIDTAIVWFYLASANDRWSTANIGYAFFKPGEFTVNTTGRDMSSNFVYLEMTYS